MGQPVGFQGPAARAVERFAAAEVLRGTVRSHGLRRQREVSHSAVQHQLGIPGRSPGGSGGPVMFKKLVNHG